MTNRALAAACFAALVGGACLETAPAPGPRCFDCHGSEANAAPPSGLGGLDDPGSRSVGAHQVHLTTERMVPAACDACHVVPETLDSEGHIDSGWPAEVKWGPSATLGGASDPFDAELQTCAVYCHGTTVTGGGLTEPAWTDGPEVAQCDSCHGSPPPPPHPPNPGQCRDCHTRDAATQHVDGIVQLSTPQGDVPCGGCHGEGQNDLWPPPDLSGNVDTKSTGVGAHEAHRASNGRAAPVLCSACHVVPATVNAKGHRDPAPAEVIFSGLSVLEGVSPVWTGATCSDTYCHTAGDPVLSGTTILAPAWRTVDGSQVGCNSCHTWPPPLPHPANTLCGSCHPNATADGTSFTLPLQHVDGIVDLNP